MLKEQGLISLDRLHILKERFLKSADDYKNLLISLEKNFKKNNTEQITYLQKLETEKLKTILNRYNIFNAHAIYLEKKGFPVNKIKSEVYNTLEEIKNRIKSCEINLTKGKKDLEVEIAQVGNRLKNMRRVRDFTAQRIDIKT